MADSERTLDIILKYGLDSGSLAQTQQGVTGVTNALQNQEKQLRANRMELRELSQVFTLIGVAGAAIWVPAIAAANSYIKTYGQTEAASSQWLATQQRLKTATVDIGRVVVEDLLPAFEKAADLAERFAAWAEKNPKAVGAALNIAGALVAVAAAGKIFTEVDRAIVDIQLLAAGMMKKAADEQLLAAGGMAKSAGAGGVATAAGAGAVTAGGVAISGLLGVGVGIAGYDMLANQLNLPSAGTIGKQIEAVAAYYVGNMFKNVPGQARPGNYLFNQISTPGASTGGSAGAGANQPSWFPQATADFVDYQKQVTDATTAYSKQRAQIENTYEKQRTDTVNSYAQQRAQAEQAYNQQTATAYRDFIQSEGDAERKYYEDRLKTARDNSEQLLKMEQDHQIQTSRDLQDHQDRQKTLLESRDGLAMIREDEQYEKDRQRKEEDYALQVSRFDQQAAQTMRDNDANFAAERAQRQRDFQQKMADNAANFKIEQQRAAVEETQKLKDLDAANADQLAQLQSAYNDQLTALRSAFIDRLNALDRSILGDLAAYQQALAVQDANFIAWLQQAKAQITGASAATTGKASGGYIGNIQMGNTRFGEQGYEYVLSHQTTQTLEKYLSGKLTQEQILSSVVAGGKSGGNYNDHRNLSFYGMTEADRASIRRDIVVITQQAIVEAFGT